MIHLVTFSDESMSRSRELCMSSASDYGVSEAHGCDIQSLQTFREFRDNKRLFWGDSARQLRANRTPTRGFGFWSWKAMLVGYFLSDSCENGDILIYADAGVEFLNNVSHIIDRMDQDIFLFANMWEHAHWCKRDIIDAIMPGAPWECFGKQVQASVIFFRVSDYTRAFVKEWLDWCLFEGGRLIDDSPSRGMNHPEFQENRWDQAILTTLGYREGVRLHYWPASYCDGAATYPRDYLDARSNHPEFQENRHDQAILTTMAYRDRLGFHKWPARYNLGTPYQFDYEQGHYEDYYPTLFNHHRKRNHEWTNAA